MKKLFWSDDAPETKKLNEIEKEQLHSKITKQVTPCPVGQSKPQASTSMKEKQRV